MVKRELDLTYDDDSSGSNVDFEDADYQTINGRRVLRSRYHAVQNMINDEREEMAKPGSDKFGLILTEMESLHHLVKTPREQVADAQALLGITRSLVASVKNHANGGLTPSVFVTHILKVFGRQGGTSTGTEDRRRIPIAWKDIGIAVSNVFGRGFGCSTMIGPIDETKLNQRKVINRRKRVRPTELARPEELVEGLQKERNDTDKNMATMFNILRKNRVVKLENLVLNRNSFAQTVENLFALSFLVKDGRAEIKVDKAGRQLVSPRNAPAAKSVISKDVALSHFIFRFDYMDWKLMVRSVGVGEELMPHRNSQSVTPGTSITHTNTHKRTNFVEPLGQVVPKQNIQKGGQALGGGRATNSSRITNYKLIKGKKENSCND